MIFDYTQTQEQKPEGTITTVALENILNQTMILSLSFSRFGNSRNADVEVKTTGAQKRFRKSKQLLDSPELDAIRKADMALRMWIDMPTRCWKYDRSLRLVPNDIVEDLDETCTKYQTVTRPALVKAFLAVYQSQVENAKVELGDQFNPYDYGTLAEVEAEFSFEYKFLSFNTPEKLATVSPKVYQKEKEKAAQNLVFAAQEMREGMRLVFQKMVDHLLEILRPDVDGKSKKLHSTTVTKLQDFLNTFELRNVTDDVELQKEVAKLKQLMAGVDADKIRESDNLKSDLVKQMNDVSTSMASLVEVTGRKFR